MSLSQLSLLVSCGSIGLAVLQFYHLDPACDIVPV
uniref:Uncharacterized protein n=1 Tax=Anguilla anguilla TaxID=7936 RepID=A0A0E9UTV4_ANGAN